MKARRPYIRINDRIHKIGTLRIPTKVLRRELALLVKMIVLLRDGEKCSYCGTQKDLQAAHVKSQGKYGRLRYCTYNVIILCRAHHLYGWHKEPRDWLWWFEEKWPGRLDRLDIMAATAPKLDLPLLRIALEAEYQDLKGEKTDAQKQHRSA